jgi:hypothetical protein
MGVRRALDLSQDHFRLVLVASEELALLKMPLI